mmetsp:Transcript_45887/g.141537  ORF Transcript_45887/g.141537 Transcript_45887/m.141537 type:complete len:297 (-) Transcript_45887:338-1228(-)
MRAAGASWGTLLVPILPGSRQALGLLGASHAELMPHHHARSAPLCEAPLARREGRERVGAREEVEQRVDAGEVAVLAVARLPRRAVREHEGSVERRCLCEVNHPQAGRRGSVWVSVVEEEEGRGDELVRGEPAGRLERRAQLRQPRGEGSPHRRPALAKPADRLLELLGLAEQLWCRVVRGGGAAARAPDALDAPAERRARGGDLSPPHVLHLCDARRSLLLAQGGGVDGKHLEREVDAAARAGGVRLEKGAGANLDVHDARSAVASSQVLNVEQLHLAALAGAEAAWHERAEGRG